MGPLSGIAAGVAAALGAMALIRAFGRRAKVGKTWAGKKTVDNMAGKRVIDFVFDRDSGAYRAK